jgi:hypothetical protein
VERRTPTGRQPLQFDDHLDVGPAYAPPICDEIQLEKWWEIQGKYRKRESKSISFRALMD